jgi:outer membrane biogenesis lipoprotein LolB
VILNKVSIRIPWGSLVPGLLLLIGCTAHSPESPNLSSDSPSVHFVATGKVLFQQPDQKHSGDLELRFSKQGQLRMQIFTPFVGSLLYELRADQERLMVIDYHNEWYVLKVNQLESRRQWLGMDLSLEELGWLLQGLKEKPPQGWTLVSKSSDQIEFKKSGNEIKILFDGQGRILSMEKFKQGLAEYEVKISSYREASNHSAPRILQIIDFSGTYQMRLVFSGVRRPESFKQPISFEKPDEMESFEMPAGFSGS